MWDEPTCAYFFHRLSLQIRAGLHTGEIERRDGEVGGIAVHLASRVMGAGAEGHSRDLASVQRDEHDLTRSSASGPRPERVCFHLAS
jgi:class 3 adenylate cyclase